MTFSQLISDLRKGCGENCIVSSGNYYICSLKAKIMGGAKFKPKLCKVCQAKLDQTLLCEKIAEENKGVENDLLNSANLEIARVKQKHKDFVEKEIEFLKGKIEKFKKVHHETGIHIELGFCERIEYLENQLNLGVKNDL
jgi:hypothetical protein